VIVEDDFELSTDDDQAILNSDEILAVNGEFSVGDTVLVRKGDGTKLAKAKSNYSSCLLSFIAEQSDRDFANEFQQKTGPIISDKNIAVLEKE
jgi:glutamate 5-kinase